MTYKDLKVIDSNWIDRRIECLNEEMIEMNKERNHKKEIYGGISDEENEDFFFDLNYKSCEIRTLEIVKSKLIDATPILEKAYNTGYTKCYYNSFSTTQKPGFEELLNTEIKLLNNE